MTLLESRRASTRTDQPRSPQDDGGSRVRLFAALGALGAVTVTAIVVAINFISVMADSPSVVVAVFDGSWLGFIVALVGFVLVVASVLMLPRLWRDRLKMPVVVVTISIIVGAFLTGWATGHAARTPDTAQSNPNVLGRVQTDPPGARTSSTSPTTSPPTPPVRLQFTELKNNGIVPPRGPIVVRGNGVPTDHRVVIFLQPLGALGTWTYLCDRDSANGQLFNCDVQFGDRTDTAAIFYVSAAEVIETDYSVLADMHNAGKWFDQNAPPVKLIALSEKIRVQRG